MMHQIYQMHMPIIYQPMIMSKRGGIERSLFLIYISRLVPTKQIFSNQEALKLEDGTKIKNILITCSVIVYNIVFYNRSM